MRLTPHVNLGGKSGVPRLTTYKGGLGKAFWQETKLDNAIIKAKIKRLMTLREMEDKAARERHGKLEMKMWWIFFCILLIGVVVLVGKFIV